MVLNYVWIGFFLLGTLAALLRWIVLGDPSAFPAMMEGTFKMAKLGFEIALGLTGLMTLWLGLMKVGEAAGVVRALAWLVRPLFRRIFPEIPPDHPAMGAMLMNISANMLGLDNAATPLGIKAMKEMQSLNPTPDRATNAQIMFLVLNTSGLTLIPITIILYRQVREAEQPTDVFIPILLATFVATLGGILITAIFQRIRLWDSVVMAYLGGLTALIGGVIYLFLELPPETTEQISKTVSGVLIVGLMTGFVAAAAYKRVPVYETFVEGAKEGFAVSIQIIPFLVAILVGVGVFRESGALGILIEGIRWVVEQMGGNADFVPALPTAFMRPFSGGGARALMFEAMNTYGVDSFVGRLVSIMQGSTDTTFYVLAVYFGAVKVRQTRHAVACGLFADLCGLVAAIAIAYVFFGG